MPRGDGTGPRGEGPGTGRGAGGCVTTGAGGMGVNRRRDIGYGGALAGADFGAGATGRNQSRPLTLGDLLWRLFERLTRK